MYHIVYGFVYTLSLLPLRALYCISDMLYPIVRFIIRYRREVVEKNLIMAFPDMTRKERKEIERKFYHCFCDYFFETIKLLSISEKKLAKHLEYIGGELFDETFERGQNAALMFGHYCNWEWTATIGMCSKRRNEVMFGAVYHKLKSKIADRLFIKIRKAHGATPVKKSRILRYLMRIKQENRRALFGYISDQSPKWQNIHLWIKFLNNDTPVFTGGERIMRKFNDSVFYLDMKRPKRGKYVFTIQPMFINAKETEEFEITREYFRRLEVNINEHPEFYLWSHNRWKRTKEEYDKRMANKN